MIAYIFALILIALCLVAIALRKSYAYVPLRELKRQARMGDVLAQTLYKAASYGGSLQVFLWIVIGLSASASFVLFGKVAPWWLAFLSISLMVWLGFAWLPATRLTGFGARLAVWITPALMWLMRYIYVPFDKLANRLGHHVENKHTGLYNQDDLHELLERQKAQTDSRITQEKLDLLMHVLRLDEITIGQVMKPISKVPMVTANDTVSPILMNELHKKGVTEFPVYNGEKSNIKGIVLMTDLVHVVDGRSVEQVMRSEVAFVHEDASLEQVLQAYAKTRQPLFMVVNNTQEVAGAISVADVLDELFGREIGSNFDGYYDARIVAEESLQTIPEATQTDADSLTEQTNLQPELAHTEESLPADAEEPMDTASIENIPKTDEEVVE